MIPRKNELGPITWYSRMRTTAQRSAIFIVNASATQNFHNHFSCFFLLKIKTYRKMDIDRDVRATSKKRKTFGRVCDASKRLRLQSHTTGKDCRCKRLQCFVRVNEFNRRNIIKTFNEFPTYNAQNLYLTGLITVKPVTRRRPRKPAMEAKFHEASCIFR